MKMRSPTSTVSSQFRGTSLTPTWIGQPIQLHLNHLSIYSRCHLSCRVLDVHRVKVAVHTFRVELTTSVLTRAYHTAYARSTNFQALDLSAS